MTEMHAEPDNQRTSGAGTGAYLEPVSMGDVLNRRVALEWFESVAIVAGLCSTLVDEQATGMPPARAIVLTPDGTIELAGPDRTQDKAALPRLLHKLLGGRAHPTPLRLLVLHAISSEGNWSPLAFGQSLAFYERPGRADLIRVARQRCLDTPLPEPGSIQTEEDLEPLETEIVLERPSKPSRRRAPLVAAGMMMCAGTVAMVVAGAYRDRGRVGSGIDAIGAVEAVVAHVKETGRGLVQALAAQLTSDTGRRPEAVDASVVAPPPARRLGSRRQRVRDVVAEPVGPAAVVEHKSTDVLPDTADPDGRVVPDADFEAVDATLTAGPIIDVDDSEVIAPRLLDPVRLPPWAQPSADASENEIELHISETGAVERVRMVSPPTRLTDMMILSAAKTWMFAPASKEGRPIPYRLTLNWVSPVP